MPCRNLWQTMQFLRVGPPNGPHHFEKVGDPHLMEDAAPFNFLKLSPRRSYS